MKLFRISQDRYQGYDTFDSAVVAAEDEESARRTHPGAWLVWPNGTDRSFASMSWVRDPADVKVEYLGEARPGTEAGVICASFNAG